MSGPKEWAHQQKSIREGGVREESTREKKNPVDPHSCRHLPEKKTMGGGHKAVRSLSRWGHNSPTASLQWSSQMDPSKNNNNGMSHFE